MFYKTIEKVSLNIQKEMGRAWRQKVVMCKIIPKKIYSVLQTWL